MDLARSIQDVTEEVMLRLARTLHRETGREQPVPGRRGRAQLRGQRPDPARGSVRGALDPAGGRRRRRGARRSRSRPGTSCEGQPRKHRRRPGLHAGGFPRPGLPERGDRAVPDGERTLRTTRLADDELFDRVARELAAGKVVGWFQGRMEFGPRALGARSILGDARNPKMQSVMNLKIKYRESFRPFAPSVLRERVADYFELDMDSPYMLLVAPVLERRRTATPEAEEACGASIS